MKHILICMSIAATLMIDLQPVAAQETPLKAPTASSWSGCYVGANTGFARADVDAVDTPFRHGPFAGAGFAWNDPPFERIGTDESGFTGGVEAGCDRQLDLGGKAIVLGGVIDFSLMNLAATGTSAISSDTHTSFDMDWAASARLRAGFVAADDVLLYVTGGVALADVTVRAYDRDVFPGSGLMNVSNGGTKTGWVLGGGAEWRFQPNWSVGLEYLHYDFGSVTATGAAIEPLGAFPRFKNDIDADVIRIGLKWRM